MRVTNWCRKLAAALVALGLAVPAAASAAALNTNLVQNPGFENVNPAITCCYSAVQVIGWADGTQDGFAYDYAQNYDNGGPLAGGGTFYFTSNASGPSVPDVTQPGQVAQDIDLSTGPTAGAIAAGLATYQLGAFFSSYLTDGDLGNVQVDFLDGGGGTLGSALITDNDPTTWTQVSTSGPIPLGTATVRMSLFGTPITAGPDGYIDNVDFRVLERQVQVPQPATILLLVVGLAGRAILVRRRTNDP